MFHLFEACGIELEYMIVTQDLSIAPIADELLKEAALHDDRAHEAWPSQITIGKTGWSNELVLHVIELKTAEPTLQLAAAEQDIVRSLSLARSLLNKRNPLCMLLGTSAHPFYQPGSELRIWPHASNEIFSAYDRIFNCGGHGFSNVQSMHINLPFSGDDEFGRLHGAIRIILPLLSALCASSPILESRLTPYLDARLEYYRTNQNRIPSIAGRVIPEPVFSMQQYQEEILQPMYDDIAPLDPDGILQDEWLNSRGAIARFDRMAIEIRTMDIQECPGMDLASAGFVLLIARALCNERYASTASVQQISTDYLVDLMDDVMRKGRFASIQNRDYLACFGITSPLSVRELFQHLLTELSDSFPEIAGHRASEYRERLQFLISRGSPAERMLQYLRERSINVREGEVIPDHILNDLYKGLGNSLGENRPFMNLSGAGVG